MRIIKNNGKIERKHKCWNCKSIFAYTPKDKTIFGNVWCPVCQELNTCSMFDKKIRK